MSLLQRLASVGLGRKESEEEHRSRSRRRRRAPRSARAAAAGRGCPNREGQDRFPNIAKRPAPQGSIRTAGGPCA